MLFWILKNRKFYKIDVWKKSIFLKYEYEKIGNFYKLLVLNIFIILLIFLTNQFLIINFRLFINNFSIKDLFN